jgi:hypothetical protein
MLAPDQELSLQDLAHSIRQCIETLGPACTARLLGTVASDLIEAHEATTGRPRPDGQDAPDVTAVRLGHFGADPRLCRHAGQPSASTQ